MIQTGSPDGIRTRVRRVKADVSCPIDDRAMKSGSPWGIRTPVSDLRSRRPSPLDEWAMMARKTGLEPAACG